MKYPGDKSTERENNECLPGTKGVWGKWGVTTNGYGVSFPGDENVLKLIVMMVVLL